MLIKHVYREGVREAPVAGAGQGPRDLPHTAEAHVSRAIKVVPLPYPLVRPWLRSFAHPRTCCAPSSNRPHATPYYDEY